MADTLADALASLGKTLHKNKQQETWYCENCGLNVRNHMRCRMCGKEESGTK